MLRKNSTCPRYLIGGFVRDKLLGRVTKDADIVCVGDGIALAHKVAERFSTQTQRIILQKFRHRSYPPEKFFTWKGRIIIPKKKIPGFEPTVPDTLHPAPATGEAPATDWDIEFVGARKESYQYHSRKPIVKPGTLEEDQLRRDFTINALAISLNPGDYGKLLDPFNGLKDLEKK
jgi:tRNA nucleotidyltransferase/poly(A) polymerase